MSQGKLPLNDMAGAAGRMDVLVRALMAGLLTSHGLRHDTEVVLHLMGGPGPGRRRPRVLAEVGERELLGGAVHLDDAAQLRGDRRDEGRPPADQRDSLRRHGAGNQHVSVGHWLHPGRYRPKPGLRTCFVWTLLSLTR